VLSAKRGARLVPVALVLGVVPLAALGAAVPASQPGPGPTVAAGADREPLEDPATPIPLVAATGGPDAVAGVVARVVPPAGTGTFTVVPGSVPAPGTGAVLTVRVEVENGLPVEVTAFARFVMDTLNDARGWGHDGAMTFARTGGEAEIVVRLASPETTGRLCAPIDTAGPLSCRVGRHAVVNLYRWVEGSTDYHGDLTAYRSYVVNHEVGHVLGHEHVDCPAPAAPAPVMQQQSLGLDGCSPNPWPYPG
jgi:Protein of unknown function (DUF3152)